MITNAAAIAALLMGGANAPQVASDTTTAEAQSLASHHLADGQTTNAINALEERVAASPDDPALLINLGIAHAQKGQDKEARALFERALVSPNPIELETADGNATDSRRLARKAIRMLDRGEFAPKLSRRD
ncbi:MAG: tetratricopeptide repeat protein [Pseudomonadota bacterium]